jgi:hypothetical protein
MGPNPASTDPTRPPTEPSNLVKLPCAHPTEPSNLANGSEHPNCQTQLEKNNQIQTYRLPRFTGRAQYPTSPSSWLCTPAPQAPCRPRCSPESPSVPLPPSLPAPAVRTSVEPVVGISARSLAARPGAAPPRPRRAVPKHVAPCLGQRLAQFLRSCRCCRQQSIRPEQHRRQRWGCRR